MRHLLAEMYFFLYYSPLLGKKMNLIIAYRYFCRSLSVKLVKLRIRNFIIGWLSAKSLRLSKKKNQSYKQCKKLQHRTKTWRSPQVYDGFQSLFCGKHFDYVLTWRHSIYKEREENLNSLILYPFSHLSKSVWHGCLCTLQLLFQCL